MPDVGRPLRCSPGGMSGCFVGRCGSFMLMARQRCLAGPGRGFRAALAISPHLGCFRGLMGAPRGQVGYWLAQPVIRYH
jgi:hypothetical protein